jgi:amidophosphoribosyltransferase
VAHPTSEDVATAVRRTLALVRGAYSVVTVLEVDRRPTLVAFRDPHGIRPCVYGRRQDGAWMVASESVALDVLDIDFVAHLPPGHLGLFRAGEEPDIQPLTTSPGHRCVFEDVYFARPDSRTPAGRVLDVRARLGARLAAEWRRKNLSADVVVAVPDTSRPAAEAMAWALGVRSEEGFIKNRYSGRTFIMPDDRVRQAALRLKLNPIDEVFRDRHVVLVDDSVVRGNTMRRLLSMVRRHAPKSLHVAIFSPAVRNPCFYGIDMPSRDELVAGRIPPEEVEARLALQLGADSLTFLSADALREEAGPGLCAACFDGRYPVPLAEDERTWILRDRRPTLPNEATSDTILPLR